MLQRQSIGVYIDEKEYPIFDYFTYEKNFDSFVGIGRLRIPFDHYYWEELQKEHQTLEIAGGTDKYIEQIFTGEIKNVINEGNTIYIEAIDFGEQAKRPFDFIYKETTIENVLKKISRNLNFNIKFDQVPQYILEKTISRSDFIETPANPIYPSDLITQDTNNIVTGFFYPESYEEIIKYEERKYITGVENYCPWCESEDTIEFSSQKNAFICSPIDGCGKEYYGISLKDKKTNIYKLKNILGPYPAESYYKKKVYSSVGTTYEDEIRYICRSNGLYAFLDPYKTLIIRDLTTLGQPEVTLQGGEIKYKSQEFLRRKEFSIPPIIVQYKDGTLKYQLSSYNEQTPLKYTKINLSKNEAEIFARNVLIEQLKKYRDEVKIQTLLNTRIYPGIYVSIPIFTNTPLFVNNIRHIIKRGVFESEIIFNIFPETIFSVIEEVSISNTKLTYENIAKTGSYFSYDEYCNKGSCLKFRKAGNTFALSDWLFEMLKKIEIPVRIIEYTDSLRRRKRYIEVKKNNQWKMFDYTRYKYDSRFIPNEIILNKRIIMEAL